MKNEYRPFKKGDLVRIVENKGRSPRSSSRPYVVNGRWNHTVYEVTEDEDEYTCTVKLREYNADPADNEEGEDTIHFSFLKLITCADKRIPYEVIDSPNTYNIVDHRRNGNGCIITLHKLEPSNTKELADKLCKDLNNSATSYCPIPGDTADPEYYINLNDETKGIEIRHNKTSKVQAVVFFGDDGYKLPKSSAEAVIEKVKDIMEDELGMKKDTLSNEFIKALNLPCADCARWTSLHEHGSTSYGDCSMKVPKSTCSFVGPFDICPYYKMKNN